MNEGKKFEQDFKNSIPPNTDIERFKDQTGAWGQSDNQRFTGKNICDFLIYRKPILVYAELKTHTGKSIPYTDIDRQYKQMLKKYSKNIDGEHIGYILNFRDLEETYYMDLRTIIVHKAQNYRKSVEIDYCREHGLIIAQELKRTRHRYNVSEWIDRLEKEDATTIQKT